MLLFQGYTSYISAVDQIIAKNVVSVTLYIGIISYFFNEMYR